MKSIAVFCVGVIFIFTAGCNKSHDDADTCYEGQSTSRTITNSPARILFSGGTYYIVEDNTIDTRLLPCSLPSSFQSDHLAVTVSGNVKQSVANDPGPCCAEYFDLTSIE